MCKYVRDVYPCQYCRYWERHLYRGNPVCLSLSVKFFRNKYCLNQIKREKTLYTYNDMIRKRKSYMYNKDTIIT